MSCFISVQPPCWWVVYFNGVYATYKPETEESLLTRHPSLLFVSDEEFICIFLIMCLADHVSTALLFFFDRQAFQRGMHYIKLPFSNQIASKKYLNSIVSYEWQGTKGDANLVRIFLFFVLYIVSENFFMNVRLFTDAKFCQKSSRFILCPRIFHGWNSRNAIHILSCHSFLEGNT